MTGGEHYREAERMLAAARDTTYDGKRVTQDEIPLFIAAAHVHAAAMVNDTWGRDHVLEPPRGESLGRL
ncbi:hypothetical protein [Actinocrispum wychmicini]|uniref:Uncharacterized protein n=1 Tax=Actinocrispum wychmicini TaxID=1213861 RepID=A0A4R2JJJ4_9PSEU|nr:hypothetical protein [Actinocrispum wychmicini]TCO57186.1 hypothetical protein EV192_106663 [Actinocrispum wychmicini]